MIERLLCDVEHRLGTRSVQEIKVMPSFERAFARSACVKSRPIDQEPSD